VTAVYADPLVARQPGTGAAHPASYWNATAGPQPDDDGPLRTDRDCDVAIIGAGYTGLSCAWHLARMGGGSTVVLEANRPGWGCSGRNGSFARPAIGRVPYGDWHGRWGEAGARAMFAEALAGLDSARDLIATAGIDCDAMPDGWLKLAHKPSRVEALRREQQLLRERFDWSAEFLDAAEVGDRHVRGGEAYGALRWPVSFAMHPLKLVYGLVAAARAAGAVVHSGSPVLGIERDGGRYVVRTPSNVVRARTVVVATNGYTLEKLFPFLRARLMPVLSNIVVTQPLSPEELAEGNFVSSDCMTDTRHLLYYFRRLPDGRIMLGGKGPLRETPAAMEAHKRHLLDAVSRKFPFMRAPRADYFWGGWVALSPDSIPHIATAEDDSGLHYALGYTGSGVSFSIHAGKRLAERITGAGGALPAPVSAPLPRFPFAAFRRLGQAVAMRWYGFKDDRG
jgi:gamma-glutamylputrescine oxidase